MRLASLFLLANSILASCGKTVADSDSYPEHVGDIVISESDDFKACDEKRILQYYNFVKGVQYRGDKPALLNHFSNVSTFDTNDTGYLTIRFVVNCKGETGRFRVEGMNSSYESREFSSACTTELLTRTQQLDGWLIGTNEEGEAFDYYQYLTFKLEAGKILEILP